MQLLKKMLTHGLVVLGLSFGFTAPAVAETPKIEDVKLLVERGNSFYQDFLGYLHSQG